jgi:acyl-coenzyme A synthetase/AMP-(fatty) acid ligase
MAERECEPGIARTGAGPSRMLVSVPPGPVDARKSLYGALMTAGTRRHPAFWVADHQPLAVGVDEDGAVSAGDIATAASRLVAVLHRQDVAAGDWCAVWLEQPLDVMLAVAALTGIGAIPVVLSPKLDPALAAAALEPVRQDITFLAVQRLADAGDIHRVPVTRRLLWEEVAAAARREPPHAPVIPAYGVSRGPADPYVVTHTSGTTGIPKLAIHTVRSFFEQAVLQSKGVARLRLRGHLAMAMSPVHIRTLSGYLGLLLSGAPITPVVCQAEDAGSMDRILRTWRPGYLETHPNTFVLWEELADSGAMESVRVFLATFDATHPGTVERLLMGSRRHAPVFVEQYAQSECGLLAGRIWSGGEHRAARSQPGVPDGHALGWAVPGYSQIRVADERGADAGCGEPGRIMARTRGRFGGYLNMPGLFEKNLTADGWWDTGDYGILDQTRQVYLLDRQVERLSRAPSAVAIEDILLRRFPELAEAVVMELDDRLVPVVASRAGAPLEEGAWDAATGDLADLSPPVLMAWDDIPRTATGKVRRAILRQQITQTAPTAEQSSHG